MQVTLYYAEPSTALLLYLIQFFGNSQKNNSSQSSIEKLHLPQLYFFYALSQFIMAANCDIYGSMCAFESSRMKNNSD